MAASKTQKRAVLVVGAGEATGGAIARRFAREGYAAICTRRELASLEAAASVLERFTEVSSEGADRP